ncbi:MAG: TIM barrel protein [Planctomycetota bacterium]|nr:TIM barrel protein [Planctomycetota bacterium]
MRLGGPVLEKCDGPEEYVAAVKRLGYSACWPSVGPEADDATAAAFVAACRKADVVISEVGAWSNTISPDDAVRKAAIDKCVKGLAHAERLGAFCCVNITGSRGAKWDGPHPDNLSEETFALIVDVVRQIIDAVKPTRTCYTLETMPWTLPDSPDSYLRLIKAIDRKAFAVHLDPVNMVNCPSRAYRTGDFIRECFEKLGPWIRNAHAKDIRFSQHLTVHLDECRPGTGLLDYATYLREMDKLPPDVSLMLEHLKTAEEYAAGAEHIRGVAKQVGVQIR